MTKVNKGAGSGKTPVKQSQSHGTAPRDSELQFAFPVASLRAPLLAWYRQQNRRLPWRQPLSGVGAAVTYPDPYRVWVSEIMLQQTLIKVVIPVYERFLQRFPTVEALAAATDDEVRESVRGLGYYRRFRFMHAAARAVTAAGSGAWPRTFAGWKQLPGVGDYTAAAVSSIAFGAAAAVVDGNVERVFCRLLDLRAAPNEPRLKPVFQRLAATLLDPEAPGDFNQALMELGQTVCTLAAPRCGDCPLSSGCLAYARASQSEAPATKLKTAKPVGVNLLLLILHRQGGRVAILRRPAQARFLSGLDGFLTGRREELGPWQLEGWSGPEAAQLTELLPESDPFALFDQRLSEKERRWLPVDLGSIKHGITHHKITALVLSRRVEPSQLDGLPSLQWVEPAAVEAKLTGNLDRKAWALYQQRAAVQNLLGVAQSTAKRPRRLPASTLPALPN